MDRLCDGRFEYSIAAGSANQCEYATRLLDDRAGAAACTRAINYLQRGKVKMHRNDVAIPQLPSRSLARTMEFYRRLGFDGGIVSPRGDYAILRRANLEVHFFLHPTLVPEESAFGCYFRVADVDAFFRAFAATNLPSRGIPRIDPVENKTWGMREFAIVDEDGSLIRIGQILTVPSTER